jgi:antitoxin component YwqK of YwqJK toxin-antitoxin module
MRSSIFMGSLGLLALTTACNTNRCCDEGVVVVKQSYVHKYGVEVDPVGWNERGGHGQVVSTQKNGITITQSYSDGILQGETTYTFPHSSAIEKVSLYHQGNLISEVTHYPSGGNKMFTEYNSSRPDYIIISQWYENGTKRSRETFISDRLDEGTYYDYKGDVESNVAQGTGIRYERDDLGQLMSSENYDNGTLTETTFYHPNRNRKEVIPYANGTIHGVRKFYFVGGDPERFEEWTNGRQTGITTMFQHGEKIAEVPYVNGSKNGVEKRFRDGEYVVEEISWTYGRQSGPHTVAIGNDKTIDWYYNDKLVTRTQYERMVSSQPR